MKRSRLHFWVALASALLVMGVAVVDLRGSSPGPLSAVHGSRDELVGRQGCSSCHGGWFQTMSGACLECHEEIDEHVEAGIGLHGSLDSTQAMACALCHSEHHGPGFVPVNVQSFVMAVSAAPEDFDHGVLGFPFAGEHLELDCAECHENADADVLGEGEHRFLGLERDCASCHDDPHEGDLVAFSCDDCHLQDAFDVLEFVGHEDLLHLAGGHADSDCRECHGEGEPHALERLGLRSTPAARACADCHDSPHTGSFLAGFERVSGEPRERGCVGCHAEEHEGFRSPELELAPEHHALSGFELVEPHAELACAKCHAPGGAKFARRYPGRAPADCAACHDDPHGGQFDGGARAELGCLACHDRLRFEPHAFDVERHAETGLELTGRHLETDCVQCHLVPDEDGPRRFRGTDAECAACHADAHRGVFDAVAERRKPVEHGLCAHCHDAESFAGAREFQHGAWTGFPVDGAHAQAECEACHVPAVSPDPAGRTFGFVHESYGEVRGCETCHADPHEGAFDGRELARLAQGRASCARCHLTSSFRAFPTGFDHGAWTGFALEGAHAAVDCTRCHAPVDPLARLAPSSAAPARSLQPAVGSACSLCHEGPHGSQFSSPPVRDCGACHAGAGTESFVRLDFDHTRDAGFRLDRGHELLDCDACHFPEENGGVDVVRYRGVGRECSDCHDVHRDGLRRRRGE